MAIDGSFSLESALERFLVRCPKLSCLPRFESLSGKETTEEEVVNLVAELFLHPCYTIPLIGCFRPIARKIVDRVVALLRLVPNLGSNSDENAKESGKFDDADVVDVVQFHVQSGRGLILHELACLAFCRMLVLAPFLLGSVLTYFKFAPPPVERILSKRTVHELSVRDRKKYISMVSEQFGPMDTCFHNGVYEVLTRLESTLVQIQKTFQAIRDEVQSLSYSHIQLATYLPMLLDDTYESAEVFVDFDKPPVFDEDEFEKISYKSNSYFMDCFYESHTSPTVAICDLDQFQHQILPYPARAATSAAFKLLYTVQPASFHLEEIAPQWHIQSNKFGDPFTCGEPNKKVELPADLFGIYSCGQG